MFQDQWDFQLFYVVAYGALAVEAIAVVLMTFLVWRAAHAIKRIADRIDAFGIPGQEDRAKE